MKYDDNLAQRYGITLVDDRVVRKVSQYSQRQNFEFIRDLVNHLIQNPNPMVVPIYRFEVLEETTEKENPHWGTYKYAYEMMRLPMLDKDEKELITKVIGNYHPVPRDTVDPGFQRAWRGLPKLMEFMNKVLADGFYTDLHNQNFLKDEEGEYRIIDLEGFRTYPGVHDRSNG